MEEIHLSHILKGRKTCLHNKPDSVSDEDKTQFLLENISIKVCSYAAVAYGDFWYPGQIIAEEGDFVTIKFLHPSNANDNIFRWPQKDDLMQMIMYLGGLRKMI